VTTALRLLALPFMLMAGIDLQTPAPRPATDVKQRIVGTWQLMTRAVTRPDGTTIVDPVLGEKPTGRLIYDASGAMSLQMMRTGRKEAISTPAGARDAKNPRVILGYDSYFGRYTVDEKAGTVTHHVDGSLFPGDLGSDWVRPFSLQGDTLTLRLTSADDGLTRTLVFQRMR
jgi:Lipocalin-like domain